MKTLVETQRDAEGPKSSDSLVPGQQAGPWVIEAELGRGGMGVVYAVKHVQIGKRAALKVMHRRLAQRQENAARMMLEAQVVNAIGHPNIVDIFDVGTTVDGRPYIVIEQLHGCSLLEVSPTIEESLAILLQISDALIAAHAAGVVHRDLKPENIFLAEDPGHFPRVKLLDWGIARILHVETRYTIEGQLVGTPRYVSPEQARGSAVTAQSDVYSFGVVAYELLLGQPPFDAATATEVMAMHMLIAPPSPRKLWPSITSDLEALLLAMLSKEPSARPSIAEVAARLGRAQAELRASRQLQRRPPSVQLDDLFEDEPPAVQRSRRWRHALSIVPFVAAIAVFVITQRSSTPSRPIPTAPPAAQARTTPLHRRSTPAPLANPVQEDCADPSVVRAEASYYLTCTATRGDNIYPLYRSTDLASWRPAGWIFPAGQRPAWAAGNYWAPELHHTSTGYAAYFSMRVRGGRNAIGVATAASVAGPYQATTSPLTAPPGGASDAHVLATGTERYLYYKTDKHPAIWVQRLAGDGTAVAGEPVLVLAATQPWEHGNVEAPAVVRDGDFYYLFYSGARYCEPSYAVGVARARSPLGPFDKLTEPILRSGTGWLAPGHTSVVDRDGERFIAYHAYRRTEGEPSCEQPKRNTRRHTRIDRLVFVSGWPQVLATL